MIDASVDADFAALERADSQRAPAAPVRRRAPATLAMLPAAPSARPGTLAVESSAEVAVPPDGPAPADPLEHLQTARVAFAAVIVLVIYWLWIRRKRV